MFIIVDTRLEPDIPKKAAPAQDESDLLEGKTPPPSQTSPDEVMNKKLDDRNTSFFAKPGILAGKYKKKKKKS